MHPSNKQCRQTQADQGSGIAAQCGQGAGASFLNKAYGYFGEPAGRQRYLPSAESLNSTRMASEVQGMTVQNNAHQEMGKVANAVLDVPAGLEMYLVISPNSDLNLGDNLYALPPGAVKLSSDQKRLLADITQDKLFHAPRFADNEWPEIAKRSWAQHDYQYYGQSFQSAELQPTGRTNEPKQTYPKQ